MNGTWVKLVYKTWATSTIQISQSFGNNLTGPDHRDIWVNLSSRLSRSNISRAKSAQCDILLLGYIVSGILWKEILNIEATSGLENVDMSFLVYLRYEVLLKMFAEIIKSNTLKRNFKKRQLGEKANK